MRKLTLVRVSYWDDFLISYGIYIMTGSFHISLFEGIYIMTGSFHISLFEGTLHDDKIHV